MPDKLDDITNKMSQVMDTKESTFILILSGLTITIIIITIFVYFYYAGSILTNGMKTRDCDFMDTMYGTLNGKITSIKTDNKMYQYPLRDYYIKSAYNACSGGNYKNGYVDTCTLKNLLKQGVRGLDFEIYSINDKPVIATSTSDNYCVKETFNSVSFSDALNVIKEYAFANSTAPNPFDPIILHLRIKSTNQKMYSNFANLLKSNNSILMDRKYSFEYYGKNFGSVNLSEMAGKIVIIVDRSNTSFMESDAFYEYVNMTSNSVFSRALHYYDIINAPNMEELIGYNKLNMTIGMPDIGSNPENPSSLTMRAYGIQMLAMRYQNVDTNLEENDVFFNEAGRAFVLKPDKLRYIEKTIEAPPAQDPSVSFATRTVSSDFYKFEI
jgi:hypothetical protein